MVDYLIIDFLFEIMLFIVLIFFFVFSAELVGKKIGFRIFLPTVQKYIYTHFMFRYILLEWLFFGLFVYLTYKYLFNFHSKINRKLAHYIKKNNLELWDTVKGKKRLVYRPDVRFFVDRENELLEIKIKLEGSLLDEKIKKITRERLEDLFKKSISRMANDYGLITFYIPLKNVSRLTSMVYIKNCVKLDNERLWDYNSHPHCLVAGMTGSGKTYFINYLICQLLANGAELTFLDPKNSDIKNIGNIVNSKNTAVEENEIAKLIRDFKQEMEIREKNIGDLGKTNFTYKNLHLKPKFLIFDEVAAFKSLVDKKVGNEIENYLKAIIMKGRSSGCFVVLITQQPNASVIGTDIRDQIGLKIAFGNLKTEIRNMVFGSDLNLHMIDGLEKGVGYLSLSGSEPYKYFAPNLGAEFDFIKEIKKIKKYLETR